MKYLAVLLLLLMTITSYATTDIGPYRVNICVANTSPYEIDVRLSQGDYQITAILPAYSNKMITTMAPSRKSIIVANVFDLRRTMQAFGSIELRLFDRQNKSYFVKMNVWSDQKAIGDKLGFSLIQESNC